MSIFSSVFFLYSITTMSFAEESITESSSEEIQTDVDETSATEAKESYIIEYENPFQYQQWSTPKGKKVFLVEDHRVPIVEVQIAIPVGVWHKIDQELHLEESLDIMTFDPQGELRGVSNILALDFSVINYGEYSLIKASFLADDTPKVQDHILKIFGNTSFDENELKRMQKNQDLGWKSNLKEPSFIGKREVLFTLFPDENDIRRLDYTESDEIVTDSIQLRSAQENIFAIKDIQFGFAGDIDREVATKWIEKLETVFASSTGEGTVVEPMFFGETLDLEKNPIDKDVTMPNLNQVYFFYFRDLVPVHSDEYPLYLVADQVLAGSFYSRLYQALRHEDGDTYGVSSREKWIVESEGLLTIETFTRADNAQELEQKLRHTIDVFQKEGITQEEFEQAIGNILGRDKGNIQSPIQIVNRQISNSMFGRDIDYNQQLQNKIQQLTLEEVNAFIQEFYVASQFGMIRVVPEE